MLPPSSRLPPIKLIAAHPPAALADALQYLSLIYSPPVRGTRRRRTTTSPLQDAAAHSTSDAEEPTAEELRTDSFERAYAIKWLTALVATLGDEQDAEPGSTACFVETAAALLAACAGTSAAGVLTRTLVFPAASGPVRVSLTDAPLDNADYASVGAQTWGGACVMGEMIAEDPGAFGLGPTTAQAGEGNGRGGDVPLRLLELGAGTGLVSLVLASLASRAETPVEIVSTDYYPSVLANLAQNVRANFPSTSSGFSTAPIITTAPLDWAAFPGAPHAQRPASLQAPFDVVFGADIVYEVPHAAWLRDCLTMLLRRPASTATTSSPTSSSPTPCPASEPAFHLIIPLRATHAAESRTVEQVFARAVPLSAEAGADGAGGKAGAAMELVIEDMQTLVCTTETPDEEVTYAYYRIGWGYAVEV